MIIYQTCPSSKTCIVITKSKNKVTIASKSNPKNKMTMPKTDWDKLVDKIRSTRID